ncbi:DUF4350 domain-containing protein [Mucilaginibacter celer]|uniref:DUF4350 domain-containing protein n=1 Tax=Mucilaginibacter celer TaxID=2305508 RepID=A0A494W2D2_9SPHI|nr:DUF4350 domain-containing protein [Mucilaginibacter celer]AYL97422.1 DUF4350 domain-containing protein [Mucilaginibacter celer]
MKDLKIYITIGCLLLGVYLVSLYNRPDDINWQTTMYYKDKVPFGTYILYDQLKQINPGAQVINTNKSIYNAFHGNSLGKGTYIILAKSITLNKFDVEAMLKYINAGNTVFMSAFDWRGQIADTLNISSRAEYASKNTSINFVNNKLKRAADYKFNRDITNQYFDSYDTAKAVVLGMNHYEHSTLLSYKFGKGQLVLCSTPLVFTNYSLLTPQGADYAQKALSYLPPAKNVYWDQFQNGDIPEDESPMRVFFNNPSLQWAYYLAIFSLLLFVIYEVKRRQRIIPVIEPLQNTTLEFVNVVGQVYYEKRNNANIAHKKTIYLLGHIREKYKINTSKLDKEFMEALSQKTGIELTFIQELTTALYFVSTHGHITDHELIRLNHLIEQFYIKSR